ncbi:MAG: FAD-binding protein, partial [Serpentinimonas sp.]|nr:FAD-binding protein [Serpentinimonas sp.]
MLVEKSVALQPYNTFGIAARAQRLLRVRKADLLPDLIGQPGWRPDRVCVLGGGSNIVLTGDVDRLVLKVEILGRRLLRETEAGYLVEAEAGEDWHDFVTWTLDRGWPGLENLALIPGSVGAAPVQNIGAYGLELQDRFHSLDAVDLHSGQVFSLDAAQCGFGYRDSVFKHERAGAQGYGLAGRALITRVRFWLPRRWQPVLGYLELE